MYTILRHVNCEDFFSGLHEAAAGHALAELSDYILHNIPIRDSKKYKKKKKSDVVLSKTTIKSLRIYTFANKKSWRMDIFMYAARD